VTEVARMLGGDPDSAVSRAHARELLENASASGEPAVATSATARRSKRR